MFTKSELVDSEPRVSGSALQGTASCFQASQLLCEPGGGAFKVDLTCLDRGMAVKNVAQ